MSGEVDKLIRAARNGARVINARPRAAAPPPLIDTLALAPPPPHEEDVAIAAWLEQNKPTALPKRAASAPSIIKIRQAVKHGNAITFTRGRSGRTVTFLPQPQRDSEGQAAGEHLRAAARSRRRKRSANKRPA